MTGGGQHQHCTDLGEEGKTEIYEQIQGHTPESGQYGRQPERPAGSVLLPRRGQNICLPPIRNDTGDSAKPLVQENAEGLQSRRHPNTKEHYGQRPEDPRVNTAGVLTEHCSRDYASNEQSRNAQRNG